MSTNANLDVIARFKNSMVHFYSNGELIYSSKNRIYRITNLQEPEPVIVAEIPWGLSESVSNCRIIDRYLKNSILRVHRTKKNEYLVSTGKTWWHIDNKGDISSIEKFSDTRPMGRGICESKAGITYIAEYNSNPNRGPVKIFRSSDLENFDVAWEFPPGSIAHVHALIVDPESDNRIWVLTGDTNAESHIHFTDDDFRTLRLFLSEGQKTRITDLIVRKNDLIWGSDSLRAASILSVDKRSANHISQLHILPGPVFYTCRNEAGTLFFGTSPTRIVKSSNYGYIFALRPDNSCREVFRCKKDSFPQYGIIYFPKGILPEDFIVFSQVALKPYEGYMIIARDKSSS
ncbi:MAG: hypothetical protein WBC05_24665 [Sedimentisphaerales bacterium]